MLWDASRQAASRASPVSHAPVVHSARVVSVSTVEGPQVLDRAEQQTLRAAAPLE